jgi:hypothetical protein
MMRVGATGGRPGSGRFDQIMEGHDVPRFAGCPYVKGICFV